MRVYIPTRPLLFFFYSDCQTHTHTHTDRKRMEKREKRIRHSPRTVLCAVWFGSQSEIYATRGQGLDSIMKGVWCSASIFCFPLEISKNYTYTYSYIGRRRKRRKSQGIQLSARYSNGIWYKQRIRAIRQIQNLSTLDLKLSQRRSVSMWPTVRYYSSQKQRRNGRNYIRRALRESVVVQ